MTSVAEGVPRSLLVVRLGAMGDVIHTLAAVAVLRCSLPHTRIGWIIEERWSELLCARGAAPSGERCPARPIVDCVHVVDTKRWRKSLFSGITRREIAGALEEVRREHYDLAVDFQGLLKSALMARLSKTQKVAGMARPREWPARFLYHHRVSTVGVHVVEQYQSLARAIATGPLQWPGITFPIDATAEASVSAKLREVGIDAPFALLTPGAGWRAKEWPAERYGAVANALAAQGVKSVITFAPLEDGLARVVENASGGAAKRISCTIGELIALTRRAKLFIGGDTGPLHLAAALQVPVVAIFGPTDPARNGPYKTRAVVLRNPASRTSLSHVSALDPGLMKISVEEVISAARQHLEMQQ